MTRGTGRGLTLAERDNLLTTTRSFAKIATVAADGCPVVSPVWFLWDGSSFLVVSKERTSLVINLRRDPRCGLLVDNPEPPYWRVSAQAHVEFLDSDFDWAEPARQMALRYLGTAGLAYAEATFSFPRVPFRVLPDRISTWNGGGYDRTFTKPTMWSRVT